MNITERALVLIRSGEIARVEDARVYVVPSQSEAGRRYAVTLSEATGPSCRVVGGGTCPAHQYNGICTHILAAAMTEQGSPETEPVRRAFEEAITSGAPTDPAARRRYFDEKVRDDPDEREADAEPSEAEEGR